MSHEDQSHAPLALHLLQQRDELIDQCGQNAPNSLRHHNDPVKISINQISGVHGNLTAFYRHIISDHQATALGVQGPDAGIVNRKIHFNDLDTVPHLAIADTACNAFLFCNGRH